MEMGTVRATSIPQSEVPMKYRTENETDMMRWNYGDAQLGSCRETIEGGNHFRFFPQDGPDANRWVARLNAEVTQLNSLLQRRRLSGNLI